MKNLIIALIMIGGSASAESLSQEEFRYSVLPSLSSTCSRHMPVKIKRLIPDQQEIIHHNKVDYNCGNAALTIKEEYDGKLSFLYNDGFTNQYFDYKGRLEWKDNGKMDIKFYDGFKNINDDAISSGTSTGFGIVNIKPE